MSLLPSEVTSVLAQLLQSLQSSNNVERSAAEEQLNNEWVVNRPDVLLMGLAETVKDNSDPSTRTFAAVLFRRIASRTRKSGSEEDDSQDLFWSLDTPQRDAIRSALLQSLSSEQENAVRHKVGDAVAEVARQYATFSGRTGYMQ